MGLRALTSGERRCIIITDNNYHYHRSSFVLITKRVISVFFSSAICQDHVGYYFRRHKRIIDTLPRAADKVFNKHQRKCLSQISYCLRLCTPICVSGSLLLAAVLLRVGNPPSHSSYLLADCISILGSPPGHPLPPVAVPPPTCTR